MEEKVQTLKLDLSNTEKEIKQLQRDIAVLVVKQESEHLYGIIMCSYSVGVVVVVTCTFVVLVLEGLVSFSA